LLEKLFLFCIIQNAPIFQTFLYRPYGRDVARLYYQYYKIWNKYTAKIQIISKRLVGKLRILNQDGIEKYFIWGAINDIHLQNFLQEIVYSCIIHYSQQLKETEESFKVQGDTYDTPR